MVKEYLMIWKLRTAIMQIFNIEFGATDSRHSHWEESQLKQYKIYLNYIWHTINSHFHCYKLLTFHVSRFFSAQKIGSFLRPRLGASSRTPLEVQMHLGLRPRHISALPRAPRACRRAPGWKQRTNHSMFQNGSPKLRKEIFV